LQIMLNLHVKFKYLINLTFEVLYAKYGCYCYK
jgi:hypothetical protein